MKKEKSVSDMSRNKKALLLVITIGIVFPLARMVAVYCLYLNNGLCEPRVLSTVKESLDSIKRTGYSDVKAKGVYAGENEYNQIRKLAENEYTAQITDWDFGGEAYVSLDFKNGGKYHLLVVPASYWSMKFKVFLFRNAEKSEEQSSSR